MIQMNQEYFWMEQGWKQLILVIKQRRFYCIYSYARLFIVKIAKNEKKMFCEAEIS